MFVRDAGERTLAETRKSNEYRQTYDAMTARAGQADQENARHARAAFLAPYNNK